MSQADNIRAYVVATVIERARSAGSAEVTIRAGDVHRDLSLKNRTPLVCAALDAEKLEIQAGVRLIRREGPKQGSNAMFTFALDPLDSPAGPKPATGPMLRTSKRAAATSESDNELPDLVLVGCVKQKQPGRHRARDLYTSTLWGGRRRYAEALGNPWFILSAEHGLVCPDDEIVYYNQSLNNMGAPQRRGWSKRVLKALDTEAPPLKGKTVEIHAGAAYRNWGLVDGLRQRGATVQVPLAHLRPGRAGSLVQAE